MMDSPFNDTDRAAVLVGFLAIIKGYSNKEIGRELGMSRVTVKLHLKRALRELDVRSARQAEITQSRMCALHYSDFCIYQCAYADMPRVRGIKADTRNLANFNATKRNGCTRT